MTASRIRCVVFDVVGTLLHSNPPVAEAYAAVARQHGSKHSVDELGQRFARAYGEAEARDRAGRLETNETHEANRWRAIVRTVLDDVDDPDACFSALWTHFARPESWAAYADVAPTLAALTDAAVRVVIASNFDARLERIVRRTPALRRCSGIVISSLVGYRKPHVVFYEAVHAFAGVPRDTILCVGDDHGSDVVGAREAGMQALHLHRQGAPAPDCIQSLAELLDRVRGA